VTGAVRFAAATVLCAGLLACRDLAAERAERIARAGAAEAAGDFAEAEQLLRAGIDRDPRDAAARTALAEHWLRRDQAAEARRVLEALPSDVPRDAAYRTTQARIAVAAAPIEDASRALGFLAAHGADLPRDRDTFLSRWRKVGFGDADLLDPLPSGSRLALAESLVEAEELLSAVSVWRTLPEDGATAALFERIVTAALRLESVLTLVELEPELRTEATPRTSLALHRLLLVRGEWAEAEGVERRFLARHRGDPRRYGLVLARARRESRAGSPAVALRLARDAARLRPDRAEAFVEEAIALRALDRNDKAEAAIRTALLVDPDDPAALRIARELDGPAPPREQRLRIEIR
jgi:Flp pilus assembly protein TadD